METGLISVIVPVYNVEDYLQPCVESIIHQTYKNIEIILIDDGSTDKSGEKCDQLAKTDERVRVYHKINGGLSSARNFGLEKAQGEFIGFVDSDDYIHPQMYEVLLKAFEESDVNVSVCAYTEMIKENFEFDAIVADNVKFHRIHREDAIRNYLHLIDSDIGYSVWRKLYKADMWKNKRFTNGIIFEDAEIMPKVIEDSTVIACCQERLYFYRIREGSITHSVTSVKDFDTLKVNITAILPFYERHPELLDVKVAHILIVETYHNLIQKLHHDADLISKLKKQYKSDYRRSLIKTMPYFLKGGKRDFVAKLLHVI